MLKKLELCLLFTDIRIKVLLINSIKALQVTCLIKTLILKKNSVF